MQTRSIWEGTAGQETGFPVYEGNTTADVVIVGGGITGLTAAKLLSDAGKKVILIEAMKIGLGTTGNSTGNLYVTVDEHLSGIKKRWNADVMKSVVRSRQAAMDLIAHYVQLHSIDCNYVNTTFNYYAEELNREAEEFIKEEYDALIECGLNPIIGTSLPLPFAISKALTVGGQAQFHPLKYVQALAKAIAGKCSIYENSPMTDFDEAKGTVKTEKGEITAQAILMATHTPKGNFVVQSVLGPYREFGVAAELKGSPMGPGIYWSVNQPKHSIRTLENGTDKYVMAVGDKFKTGHMEADYVKGLENYLRGRFEVGPFNYVWAGQQYRPGDGLPYIGKHSDKLYFLTGFSTDGLVYGTLAAMIVSDELTGKKNAWAGLYDAGRHTPLKSAKLFIKENADNAVQYLKDMPWNVDAADVKDVKPGEGKLIEHGGEKLAVYKDEAGDVHVVSAVCTHMKCIVKWNGEEKTWDCPCHGSRFKTTGEVIEGPAISDLPSKKIKGGE